MTIQWTKISGPGTVTFSDPTSLTPTVTFSARGVYVLRLTATQGSFASDDVQITYAGIEVSAGPDQTITLSSSAPLNGSYTVVVA